MIIERNRLELVRRMHGESLIGYTSGVFDLFHKGHMNYLAACKNSCDILVVGVDADSLARSRKGYPRPVQPAKVRMINVNEHAHYVFAKEYSSENYTDQFYPSLYFFSSDNPMSGAKLKRISREPYFKDAVSIPYTADISTTSILEGLLRRVS